MKRILYEQVHKPSTAVRPVLVVDFRVILHAVWDDPGDDLTAAWAARLQRGPTMLPKLDYLVVVVDDCKAMLGNSELPVYWRSLIEQSYKAPRQAAKTVVKSDKQPTHSYRDVRNAGYKAVSKLGLPLFSAGGFEADDWAGAVHRLRKAAHCNSLLSKRSVYYWTTDSDWMQLVDDDTQQFWANVGEWQKTSRLKNEAETRAYVFGKWQYHIQHPRQIAHMKHVLGDSSDNLAPGALLRLFDLCSADAGHRLPTDKLQLLLEQP